jgi:hypothetical protein
VYSEGTTVSAGTLLVNNTSGSGTGTHWVNVESGGTLGGTGIIAPSRSSASSIAVAGVLAPGGGIGTLTINLGGTTAVMTMASGGKFRYEIGTPGSGSCLRFYNFVTGDLVLNNNVIDFTGGDAIPAGNHEYVLMKFYSDNGTTLTNTGKPTSGLTIGSGLEGLNPELDYTQTGLIVLKVKRAASGTVVIVL